MRPQILDAIGIKGICDASKATTTTCPKCSTAYYTGTSHADCITAIGMCGACGMKEGAE